jgi:hypothetical protein
MACALGTRRALATFAVSSAVAAALLLAGCAGPLQSRPGTFEARTVPIKIAGRDLEVTYVTPDVPRQHEALIVFASGDAGYYGVSGEIIEHLAEQRYYLVTYDARQLIAREKKSGTPAKIEQVAALCDTVLEDARRSQGLDDSIPAIVTGYSRGATFVVLYAAIEGLREHLTGGIAIALTRRADYLERPTPKDPLSSVLVDEKGRLLTYAAIPSAGPLPFALIQASKDSYIGADEAHQLFGPDTPNRRFYRIEGSHTFKGARDVLMTDLDQALAWILGSRTP